MIDHRASPGLPASSIVKIFGPDGLPYARDLGEHGLFETHTMGCPHCGSVVVKNPDRKRPRNNCQKCDSYICDWCEAARHEPGYVHRTMQEIRELVAGGYMTLAPGSTAVRPILVPTGKLLLPRNAVAPIGGDGVTAQGSPPTLLQGSTDDD